MHLVLILPSWAEDVTLRAYPELNLPISNPISAALPVIIGSPSV